MKKTIARFAVLWFASLQAWAFAGTTVPQITQLKQVQVGEGGQIQLLFDSKISPSQIKTEFVNDIVQLSIQDVAVYPAKIISTSTPDFTKIFAYQYTPKLIRCRVSVKGKAESYQGKVHVRTVGKIVTVAFGSAARTASDSIATGAAQALRVSTPPAAEKPAASVAETPGANTKLAADEKKILDRIESNENKPIHLSPSASRKSSAPSPIRAIASLAVVLALILGGAYLFKKYGQNSALLGKIKRNGKMIEVIATQSLGPKRSIAVVKVAGRILVLGVASESISLISEIDSEDGVSHTQNGASFFANLLDAESKPQGAPTQGSNRLAVGAAVSVSVDPRIGAIQAAGQTMTATNGAVSAGKPVSPTVAAAESGFASRVRDRIRNRMEGMKEL